MPEIAIQIVYAPDAGKQMRYCLSVPEGATVRQAIEFSNLLKDYPNIELNVGIWSRAVQLSDKLKQGDRIEVYRPLHLSAMDARRVRHKKDKKQAMDNSSPSQS
jgi:putative ubiquitin-RnfH superfamily antitoxin RatB of RatAB toxin-antitoxin module